jgi:tetratricopeptide (TPR) repeat protein
MTRRDKILEFIAENPDDPFNHYALAMEDKAGDPQGALERFKQIIIRFPEYLPSYYQAANLAWEEDQLDQARDWFEIGIRLATKQNDGKALHELKAAYQNLCFEMD